MTYARVCIFLYKKKRPPKRSLLPNGVPDVTRRVAVGGSVEDDESPVAVGGHEAFRVALGKEAVFALLKMVAKTSFKHARKGDALT